MASSTTISLAARLPIADYDRFDALRMTMEPPTWRETLLWISRLPAVQKAVAERLAGGASPQGPAPPG